MRINHYSGLLMFQNASIFLRRWEAVYSFLGRSRSNNNNNRANGGILNNAPELMMRMEI